ncbi:MAG TPA: ATP-binding protein [Asticcacaulis sp.]|nr:ATP-binding protein [Asticcacaulis sp.]
MPGFFRRLRQPSLTRRLLIGVGAPLLLLLIVIALLGYQSARFEIDEVYDAQLVTAASFLRYYSGDMHNPPHRGIGVSAPNLDKRSRDGLVEYTRWRRFRVWRDGQLVLASENGVAATGPLPPGYHDVKEAGETWRFFTLTVPETHEIIEAGENIRAREELINRIFWGLILPLTLALPLMALVVWRGIVWGLKDLRGFADSVGERSAEHLEPLDARAAPAELQALSGSINTLLQRLETSLDQERLFTDNAAHELRTPLAAVRAQTEVLSGARNAGERKTALAELQKGVDRAARLMDQLLTLARLRQRALPAGEAVLRDAVASAVRDLYPEAERRSIGFNITGESGAPAPVNPLLLGVVLRNLIENAIKYAPEGSDIDIAIASDRIEIRDRGPGIPEDEREKVFARFYRLKGTQAPGSGLGLAIVRIAAAQAGCRIALFTPSDGAGLGVRVIFFVDGFI